LNFMIRKKFFVKNPICRKTALPTLTLEAIADESPAIRLSLTLWFRQNYRGCPEPRAEPVGPCPLSPGRAGDRSRFLRAVVGFGFAPEGRSRTGRRPRGNAPLAKGTDEGSRFRRPEVENRRPDVRHESRPALPSPCRRLVAAFDANTGTGRVKREFFDETGLGPERRHPWAERAQGRVGP
jgi:hypothetical protein